jgi:copper(I)-binding protein
VIRCRLLAIAAAVALIPALAGCAAGLNAQTNQPFGTTDGASTVFHDIAIRNAFVLGPGANGTLQAGQSAGMFLAMVNRGGADQLTAVSAPGTAASVTIHGGAVKLAHGQAALLTGPAPQVVLSGITRSASAGQTILVALTFQNAGTVTMLVPIVAQTNYYATFSQPASPAPTPAKRSTSPRPSPSRSAGATPAPSATP